MLLQIDEEKIRTKLEERPTAYVASPHNVETQKPDYAVPSTVVTSSTFGLPPNLEAARDRLIALRERILREGGRTFSWDDVEAEVRGARGREQRLGVRTYVDSGVLIAAIRGNSAISEVARSYLFDPLRDYITSDYVAVELIPKAAYHGNHAESEFYQDFFNRATARVPSSDALMKAAIDEGSRTGISGLDAVHVACAVVGEAAELITSEKSTKPIHRTSAVTVVSINPQPPTTPQVSGTT